MPNEEGERKFLNPEEINQLIESLRMDNPSTKMAEMQRDLGRTKGMDLFTRTQLDELGAEFQIATEILSEMKVDDILLLEDEFLIRGRSFSDTRETAGETPFEAGEAGERIKKNVREIRENEFRKNQPDISLED